MLCKVFFHRISVHVRLGGLVMNSWAFWLNHPELHLLPVPWMCSCFPMFRMKTGCVHCVCPWVWVDISSCESAYASCLLSCCTHACAIMHSSDAISVLHVPIQHTCVVLLVFTPSFFKFVYLCWTAWEFDLFFHSWIKGFQHLELWLFKRLPLYLHTSRNAISQE